MKDNPTYTNGQPQWEDNGGIRTHYYRNGRKRAQGPWKEEKMEGQWTFWREDGNLWQEGGFKEGAKHGLFRRWDREGNLEYQEEFKDGKLQPRGRTPIDDFMEGQEKSHHKALKEIRKALAKALPGAEETIRYGIPTFRLEGVNILHFAHARDHVGIYPGPEALAAFQEELGGWKTSKGALQIPLEEALPLDLIIRMARWNRDHFAKNRKGKKKEKGEGR